MEPTLELYYFPTCPYCQKVLRAADQLGIADRIALKNIHADAEANRTLLEVGGIGQVPCLFIDGKPLYESDDIVAWLRANYS